MIGTPRYSSTSAAPVRDDIARLPCLATGTPQATTTKAAAVETFSVPAPSPPVPQTSIAPAGASTVVMAWRMARAAPVISATVGPRTASAVRNEAMRISLTAPAIMAPNASALSAALR